MHYEISCMIALAPDRSDDALRQRVIRATEALKSLLEEERLTAAIELVDLRRRETVLKAYAVPIDDSKES